MHLVTKQRGLKTFLHAYRINVIAVWIQIQFMVEIFKMVYDKAPSSKVDLLTAIHESRNYFDKEYFFKLVKELKLS